MFDNRQRKNIVGRRKYFPRMRSKSVEYLRILPLQNIHLFLRSYFLLILAAPLKWAWIKNN